LQEISDYILTFFTILFRSFPFHNNVVFLLPPFILPHLLSYKKDCALLFFAFLSEKLIFGTEEAEKKMAKQSKKFITQNYECHQGVCLS